MSHRVSWWWIFTLIGLGLVKAHIHMIRLVILAAAGLMGMYLLHKLAQDFSKIQSGFGSSRIPGISKRSTNEDWLMERFPNDTQTMSGLLHNDPIGCARKYVCYISSKSSAKRTPTQNSVLSILRMFSWLDSGGEWNRAEKLGRKLGRRGGCEAAYHKCYFTGAQLDKLMSQFH